MLSLSQKQDERFPGMFEPQYEQIVVCESGGSVQRKYLLRWLQCYYGTERVLDLDKMHQIQSVLHIQ